MWSALAISIKVTAVATVVFSIMGVILGVMLARHRSRLAALGELIITLPLVLPPTVVGYYLLVLLGRGSPLFEWIPLHLVFTWQAAVVAAVVVALPLMVQSVKASVSAVSRRLEDAARTLGASEWEVLTRVTLPLARHGIIAGILLGSARALGEFGATLMVAGNIPGRTQTLPLAIYDAVQDRAYDQANLMALLMTGLALMSIIGARWALSLGSNGHAESSG
ncbi:MAG TPA: molybdate ABC transporter permease subunit [Thermoanaerobaculia bacterium]|nr:molybdate ABC transporter permease subunit [Thermoanaerobaculia bacterium]